MLLNRTIPCRPATASAIALLIAIAALPALADAPTTQPVDVSRVTAAAGEGEWRGVAYLDDGSILLGGAMQPFEGLPKGTKDFTGGQPPQGVLVRLSADGETVLAAAVLASPVRDMAVSGRAVYVAAGEGGVLAIAADLSRGLWQRPLEGSADRVDARPEADSDVAVLVGEGSRGRIAVFNAKGKPLSSFDGHQRTKDLAIDAQRERVILIGYENKRGHGSGGRWYHPNVPVQVSYLRAVDYAGKEIWTGYDWTGREVGYHPDLKPEERMNSMADTRGLRVSIGADGNLYGLFMTAGGDHILRFDPFDKTAKAPMVGGDRFHQFFNTRSEHKTVVGRFDLESGKATLVQQFLTRNDKGGGNSAWGSDGSISADEDGRVIFTGKSASGLPFTFNPLPADIYTGGGFVVMLSSDFATRQLVTRLSPSGNLTSAAVRREKDGSLKVAIAGSVELRKEEQPPIFTTERRSDIVGESDGLFGLIDVELKASKPSKRKR